MKKESYNDLLKTKVKYLLLCGVKFLLMLFYKMYFLKKMSIKEMYLKLSVVTDRM